MLVFKNDLKTRFSLVQLLANSFPSYSSVLRIERGWVKGVVIISHSLQGTHQVKKHVDQNCQGKQVGKTKSHFLTL